ncbi:MAG: hypothetical protein JNL97_09790, partial [Verrucomicrobiales bacterium]|nr:hypothetical protein [Verrucomicrobiales bacterium]
KGLRRLWLDGTPIPDRCVTGLAELRDLEELHVERTSMTEKGLEQLRALLPRCTITP